ncbi:MAG: hypothetical protein WBA51_02530 [Erythrobacter sp.]
MRGAGDRQARCEAQAGGHQRPAQLVRFHPQGLTAQKPFGFNLKVAIAPGSRINRATNSGIWLALRGGGFLRAKIDSRANLLVRASVSVHLYRETTFDDYSVVLSAASRT